MEYILRKVATIVWEPKHPSYLAAAYKIGQPGGWSQWKQEVSLTLKSHVGGYFFELVELLIFSHNLTRSIR